MPSRFAPLVACLSVAACASTTDCYRRSLPAEIDACEVAETARDPMVDERVLRDRLKNGDELRRREEREGYEPYDRPAPVPGQP